MVRNNDVVFAVNDTIFMFLDFRIWSWGPKGKPIEKKRPLFDLRFRAKTNLFQMRYPSQRERSEFGAVIQINDYMFARIRGEFVSNYGITPDFTFLQLIFAGLLFFQTEREFLAKI